MVIPLPRRHPPDGKTVPCVERLFAFGGHQTDDRIIVGVNVDIFHDFVHQLRADSLPLVIRFDNHILNVKGNAAVADNPGYAIIRRHSRHKQNKGNWVRLAEQCYVLNTPADQLAELIVSSGVGSFSMIRQFMGYYRFNIGCAVPILEFPLSPYLSPSCLRTCALIGREESK